MDEEFNDTFDYSDIIPLNYKSKSLLSNEFDEILKNTENTKIDWRKRELALKKIARICLGNQGKSDTFLQFFNGQIYPNLDIQLADLRSSLMKEACRIVSFCAKELGLLIESSMTHMMTQHVLFKIAGNSNKVISENSSRCVLNIVKYVHSIKIITNICEQKILKANNVRVLVSQCIYIIICSYKNNLIQKTLGIIIETIKTLLSDPNSDVRATTRKVFIAYKKRYENEGNNLFNELEKNVQKQINEDEKILWKIIDIKVDDSIEKNNINIKMNTNNTVKKVYSSSLSNLNNSGIKKNNINNKASNEIITHKSNLNITPVKAKKQKNFYASNIKQKSHEIKFENKNINNDNINKTYNKNKTNFNVSTINKKSLKEYIIKKENNNTKDSDNNINSNNNNDSQEFVFTNLNLLRKARLENNLKNKNKPNHKGKNKNKPINKNSSQSPTKIITESSPQLNIKTKDYNNKLKNSLKEKNLNDLRISNGEINSERKTKSEEKLLILIRKLDETNSDNDKLLVFQYFYNDFSQILKDIKYFSEVSIRKYIDKHIEYFGGEEQRIVAQVIKNMMRMIYYMYNFFSKYDIENIIKLMLIQIKKLKQENIVSDNDENENNPHNNEETSVYKLIFQLYVIILRKNEGENLIKIFFSIIKGMNELEPSNNGNNNNYDFDTFFDWLTNLIKSNPNFLENQITFKKYFKIIIDSLYIDSNKLLEFIEFIYKSYNEDFVSTFKEETEENKKKLTLFLEKNKSSIYQEILNLSKLLSTRKNSENKMNNTYNSVDEDYEELPEDIINYIKSNDLNGFKTSLEKNKNLIPSFLLLLSDNEFKEIKYIEILINFTYTLLASSGDIFIPELDKCIELFINQLIHIILTNLKNTNIIKITNDILVMTPMKLNSEKFFKTISQYLNIKTDDVLLKILLKSIKNFILDNKTKYLEKILPYFAENLLGLINHTTKEIKEEAVYCCVEIIMVVGYKFDKYLELLPKNQQNLINFFIKKRTG